MSDLVTGEGVALDLQLARLASRSLAFAIDVTLQFVLLLVGFLIATAGPGFDSALVQVVSLLVVILVLVGYPVLFETLTRGRTLGKLALGLRVVRDDGGPIGFRQALLRGLAGFFVDFWALGFGGFVAVFVSLTSAKGKRVGDLLAGTVVIRQRAPREQIDPVYMPPELRQWASDLDLSGLPDGLALAARQFLGRYQQLRGDARLHLGERLAAQVGEAINTAIPAGASAPVYLAAVLAERRQREEAKVWGEQPRTPPARPAPTFERAPAEHPPERRPPPSGGGFAPPG